MIVYMHVFTVHVYTHMHVHVCACNVMSVNEQFPDDLRVISKKYHM